MNFEKTRERLSALPLPNSLIGRMLILWFSCCVFEALSVYFFMVYRCAVELVKLMIEPPSLPINGLSIDFLETFFSSLGNFFTPQLINAILVLMVTAAIFLFVYIVLRFTSSAKIDGRRYFTITVISLVVFYFSGYPIREFQLYMHPEYREYIDIAQTVRFAIENILLFLIMYNLAKYILIKRDFPQDTSWSGELSKKEYFSELKKYINSYFPKKIILKILVVLIAIPVFLYLLSSLYICGFMGSPTQTYPY